VRAEGLSGRSAVTSQIPRGLFELLSSRQRRQVLRPRVPHIRLRQQRQDRLQRVPTCHQHHVSRQTGTEARVGLPDVRRQWRWDDRTE